MCEAWSCRLRPVLGQPRPRRRGEARGLHVYECDETSILVQTHIWRSDTGGSRPCGVSPAAVSPWRRLDGGAVALLTGYRPVDE